jgi:maltodextrin utilization protein YvdJ
MEDFYSSYAGFPVAGATLPVLAALILGIYAQNWIVIAVSVILGIGHIGIHLTHRRETLRKAAADGKQNR